METEMVEAADERADRSSRLWLREVVPGAALHRAARAERRDPLLGRVFWMGCPVPSAPLFLTSRETGWAREDDRGGAGMKVSGRRSQGSAFSRKSLIVRIRHAAAG